MSLRNRNFALFWGGLVLSGIGSQLTTVAMAWQIYLLTGSPLEIGLLGLARGVPQMIVLLYGGLLADALDRRRLMMAVQAGQFVVSASLLFFSATGAMTPLTLYLAAGLLAVFTALETPSRQALVPNLVTPEELTSALALNNAQRNVSNIAGPSMAGLLLALADPAWCYAIDALSWLAMLGALLLITARADPDSKRSGVSLGALGEGLHFVMTNPVILGFMVLDFGMTLFTNPRSLLPIYAGEILQVGAPGLGMLHAAMAAGGILGAVGMGGVRTFRRAGAGVLAGIAFCGLGTIFFAISRDFWLSLVMLACTGLGNAFSSVLRAVVNQLLTPDELRGRVSAVNNVFTTGGPQLGQFQSGILAEFWGAQVSTLAGGVATLAVVAAIACMPRVRRFELIANRAAPQQPTRRPRSPSS